MVQYVREQGSQKVVVTLEFPGQSDQKAGQEFIGRLKEIYLRKIEIGAMQEKESALESNPIVNSVGMSQRSEYDNGNTKADKSNE